MKRFLIYIIIILISNIIAKSQGILNINTKVDSIIKLSNNVFYSKPDSAEIYLKEALRLTEKYNLKKQQARIYINYGILKNESGKINDAKRYFETVLRIATEINDTAHIIAAYGNLGNAYMINGEYEKAINNFTKTINLYKKQNNEKGMSFSYGAMGNLYNSMRKFDKALTYYNLAEELFKKLENKGNIALVDLNIGIIYLHKKEYNLAENKLLSSLKYFSDNKMLLNEGKCEFTLSKLFLEKKEYKRSERFAEKALENYKISGADFDIAALYHSISYLKLKNRDFKGALSDLDVAFSVAEENNNYKQLSIFSLLLKDCYDSLGDYKNAYKYANIHKQYSDSVLNINSSNKFAELEVKFETKENKHKIEILTKNEELLLNKQRNNKLFLIILGLILILSVLIFIFIYNRQKLKSEKAAIEVEQKLLRLQMNPHFIFNSLYMIQNFLTQNDTEKTNIYLNKFAVLLRKILESSTENFITIEEEIDIIDNYLIFQKILNNNKFNFVINCSTDIEKDNVLIPPMLIQPFVENSIKYGFNGVDYTGIITINFKKENNNLKIEIIDNGIGLTKKIDSNHKSMSTEITKKRLKTLIGKKYKKYKFVIYNNKSKGTTVQFEMPLLTEF